MLAVDAVWGCSGDSRVWLCPATSRAAYTHPYEMRLVEQKQNKVLWGIGCQDRVLPPPLLVGAHQDRPLKNKEKSWMIKSSNSQIRMVPPVALVRSHHTVRVERKGSEGCLMGYSGVLNTNHHIALLDKLLYVGQIICSRDQISSHLSTGNFHSVAVALAQVQTLPWAHRGDLLEEDMSGHEG
ncbi:hypothetical protein HGM15179_004663 [Zosterops borbonicus]|uniref:Uncharacterized protein n=1 Tax=Zosterops borbonicus TaxID=364589 RepID=A0A8K1LQQ8_9PASS|nr:hypothetical protein HGM15179_004663 [Zosterops borbonicus]